MEAEAHFCPRHGRVRDGQAAPEVPGLRCDCPDALDLIRSWLDGRGRPPRSKVLLFAVAMEEKLLKNDHKGGWGNERVDWLLKRLRGETKELAQLLQGSLTDWPPAYERALAIRGEAADVANFALMIADVCDALRPSGLAGQDAVDAGGAR